MRAAVTGAGGMLGHALVPALEAAQHPALSLSRSEADVTQIEALRRALTGFRPDWVFHLAAFTKVNDCETRRDHAFLVNEQGSRNVAQAASEVGAAVLMVSTDYVFDGRATRPYREDDPTGPLNLYGASKLAGERATREANPRHLIVRTSWVYGRGGVNFPDRILARARQGQPLRVVNDQRGSPTWTEDLAPALIRLASAGQFGTYHCTNSGDCTWYEFARYLVDRTGLDVPVEPIESAALRPQDVRRPAYSVLSNARSEQVTGQRMPDWKDGAERYLGTLAPRRGAAERAAGKESS